MEMDENLSRIDGMKIRTIHFLSNTISDRQVITSHFDLNPGELTTLAQSTPRRTITDPIEFDPSIRIEMCENICRKTKTSRMRPVGPCLLK
jgi:hypothetical protein